MSDFDKYKQRGAGGTPGGLGSFLFGLILTLIGGYMLLTEIRVTTGFWGFRLFGGISPFGATMIIFIIGVVLLFMDAKSKIGWVLAGGSLLFALIGIIANLQVYFANTSLYVLLVMLVLFFGGIGLMLRALRSVE